jgi:CMP-N,N'-diacetyllegionaminic acid synthase
MLGSKKVIAIIPARGGSKGLPGKNIRALGAKPLIAWTIESALGNKLIDKTVVSTDCSKIAAVSKSFGAEVPFIRPGWLSTDEASTADVVLHVLNSIKEQFDVILLLQPTSPFRNSGHIQDALEIYDNSNKPSLVSICESQKSPYLMFSLEDDGALEPVIKDKKKFSRRQDLPKTYCLNGAIYVIDVEFFLKHKEFLFEDSQSYLMDVESSIDIDSLIDLKLAQLFVYENKCAE